MAGAGYPQQTLELERLSRYFEEGKPNNFFDFSERMKWALFGSTTHLVSNCEDVTDWDISSSGDFNAVDEGTIKHTGSNSIELVDVSTIQGTFVTLDAGRSPLDRAPTATGLPTALAGRPRSPVAQTCRQLALGTAQAFAA